MQGVGCAAGYVLALQRRLELSERRAWSRVCTHTGCGTKCRESGRDVAGRAVPYLGGPDIADFLKVTRARGSKAKYLIQLYKFSERKKRRYLSETASIVRTDYSQIRE